MPDEPRTSPEERAPAPTPAPFPVPPEAEIEAAAAPLDPQDFRAFLRIARNPKSRFVVCLGGGSIPGLVGNVALLSVLDELGLRPHVSEVWGTSAGAVAGGAWCTGSTTERSLAIIEALNRRGTLDYAWGHIARGIARSLFGGRLPDGFIRGRRFFSNIDRSLLRKRFEECQPPFRAIACLADGSARRTIFREGPLLPAIVASMSIPGIVIPARHPDTDEDYFDGGVVEKTPILSPIDDHVRLGDSRKLVLLCTHYGNDARKTRPRGFLARFLSTLYHLEDMVWTHQLREARERAGVRIMILNPHLPEPEMFSFRRAHRNYLIARRVYAERLSNAQVGATFGLD